MLTNCSGTLTYTFDNVTDFNNELASIQANPNCSNITSDSAKFSITFTINITYS